MFLFRAIFLAGMSMSSQDSEGASYVADYITNPEVYGEEDPYGWTTDEEEGADMKEARDNSSDEDEDPLPQPGGMHVDFKKSSLPDKRNKPKVQFIPSHFLHGIKATLCKSVLKLELENENLREETFSLRRKLEKKNATTPSSPPPLKKET